MIINESAGSGGDAMPWYFRKAGLGTLVGKRTWGGLVGHRRLPAAARRRLASPPRASRSTASRATWEVENVGHRARRRGRARPEGVAAGPRPPAREGGRDRPRGAREEPAARPQAARVPELPPESGDGALASPSPAPSGPLHGSFHARRSIGRGEWAVRPIRRSRRARLSCMVGRDTDVPDPRRGGFLHPPQERGDGGPQVLRRLGALAARHAPRRPASTPASWSPGSASTARLSASPP